MGVNLKIVLLVALFAFTGCFGSGEDTTNKVSVPNGKVFSVDEFDIEYPRGWRVLKRSDFPSDVPKETKLVFQNNVRGEFIVNVNLGLVHLSETMSSLDYSKKVLQEQRNGLLDFKEVKREEIQLPVGDGNEDVLLVTFTGRATPESNERLFIQLHVVKDKEAYTVTGAMRKNEAENIMQLVEAMLKSLKLK